ncbi:hypothetical protein HK405_002776 [Cladochytrium tenue]|nr:hypothetical protein HK405_002776 [Cladochytrium tenue]
MSDRNSSDSDHAGADHRVVRDAAYFEDALSSHDSDYGGQNRGHDDNGEGDDHAARTVTNNAFSPPPAAVPGRHQVTSGSRPSPASTSSMIGDADLSPWQQAATTAVPTTSMRPASRASAYDPAILATTSRPASRASAAVADPLPHGRPPSDGARPSPHAPFSPSLPPAAGSTGWHSPDPRISSQFTVPPPLTSAIGRRSVSPLRQPLPPPRDHYVTAHSEHSPFLVATPPLVPWADVVDAGIPFRSQSRPPSRRSETAAALAAGAESSGSASTAVTSALGMYAASASPAAVGRWSGGWHDVGGRGGGSVADGEYEDDDGEDEEDNDDDDDRQAARSVASTAARTGYGRRRGPRSSTGYYRRASWQHQQHYYYTRRAPHPDPRADNPQLPHHMHWEHRSASAVYPRAPQLLPNVPPWHQHYHPLDPRLTLPLPSSVYAASLQPRPQSEPVQMATIPRPPSSRAPPPRRTATVPLPPPPQHGASSDSSTNPTPSLATSASRYGHRHFYPNLDDDDDGRLASRPPPFPLASRDDTYFWERNSADVDGRNAAAYLGYAAHAPHLADPAAGPFPASNYTGLDDDYDDMGDGGFDRSSTIRPMRQARPLQPQPPAPPLPPSEAGSTAAWAASTSSVAAAAGRRVRTPRATAAAGTGGGGPAPFLASLEVAPKAVAAAGRRARAGELVAGGGSGGGGGRRSRPGTRPADGNGDDEAAAARENTAAAAGRTAAELAAAEGLLKNDESPAAHDHGSSGSGGVRRGGSGSAADRVMLQLLLYVALLLAAVAARHPATASRVVDAARRWAVVTGAAISAALHDRTQALLLPGRAQAWRRWVALVLARDVLGVDVVLAGDASAAAVPTLKAIEVANAVPSGAAGAEAAAVGSEAAAKQAAQLASAAVTVVVKAPVASVAPRPRSTTVRAAVPPLVRGDLAAPVVPAEDPVSAAVAAAVAGAAERVGRVVGDVEMLLRAARRRWSGGSD